MPLRLISVCAYLTDTSVGWRGDDYTANKMVKAVKGAPINGYFEHEIGGRLRRFTQDNVQEFVDRVPRALAKHIRRHHDEPATIVPIPNSHVVSPTTPNFKTLELAQRVAECSDGLFVAKPVLVFREVQQKSHEGGPRQSSHFERAYKVVGPPLRGPIILLDDVCTGGGHLIGAYRRLNTENSPVVLACTFGRSTKLQLDRPVGLRVENLDLNQR